MNLEILLIGLASLVQSIVGVPVEEDTKILLESVRLPFQLAIDYKQNALFFSHSISMNGYSQSIIYDLKKKTSEVVPGVLNGFANAVDQEHGMVYIGGEDGIYKYDYGKKHAVKLNITDQNVWQMFYKDGLYFTTYPDSKAYIHKNGVTKLVPELKNRTALSIASDGTNIYFYNSGELMKIVDGKIQFLGDFDVNAFNADAKGNLFFSTPAGVYKLVSGGIKKLATAENIYGFAIEGDGSLIFATDNSIVRLMKSVDECIADKENGNSLSCILADPLKKFLQRYPSVLATLLG